MYRSPKKEREVVREVIEILRLCQGLMPRNPCDIKGISLMANKSYEVHDSVLKALGCIASGPHFSFDYIEEAMGDLDGLAERLKAL